MFALPQNTMTGRFCQPEMAISPRRRRYMLSNDYIYLRNQSHDSGRPGRKSNRSQSRKPGLHSV